MNSLVLVYIFYRYCLDVNKDDVLREITHNFTGFVYVSRQGLLHASTSGESPLTLFMQILKKAKFLVKITFFLSELSTLVSDITNHHYDNNRDTQS